MSQNTYEISVEELKLKMDNNEKFSLIDVREPLEKEFADIGGELVPMDTLLDKIKDFNKDEEIIFNLIK